MKNYIKTLRKIRYSPKHKSLPQAYQSTISTMLVAPLTLLCLALSVCDFAGSTYAGRYLPMDIRSMGGDYRAGPMVAEKDANWDMMDAVKVI